MNRHFDKHTGRMAQLGLLQQVKLRQMWPTPCARDHHPNGMKPGSKVDLGNAVKMWQTPCATDAQPITGGNLYQTTTGTVRHMRPDGKSSNRGLATQVLWPTPQARDHFPAHTPDYIAAKKAQGHGMSNLNDSVGGQLNPTWVEWLMGWPLGWTDCAASGTDRFREWCNAHGRSWHEP